MIISYKKLGGGRYIRLLNHVERQKGGCYQIEVASSVNVAGRQVEAI